MNKTILILTIIIISFSVRSEEKSIDSLGGSCGFITVSNIPSRSSQLYRTSIIKINGERMKQNSSYSLSPNDRNYRGIKTRRLPMNYHLTPGHYSIELEYPKRASKRSQLKIGKHVNQHSYKTKTLELEIEANTQYYLAIQYLPENKDSDASAKWKAVVWKERQSNCNLATAEKASPEEIRKEIQKLQKEATPESLMAKLQQDIEVQLQLIAKQQEKEGKDINEFYYSFVQPSKQEVSLGLTFEFNDPFDGYSILTVSPDSSADKAGLKASEIIIALDSILLKGKNQEWLLKKLRSLEIGSQFNLTISNQGVFREATLIAEGRRLPNIEFTIGGDSNRQLEN